MLEKTTVVQTYRLEDILDESHAGGLGEEVIAHIFDSEGHAPESVEVCLCVRYDAGQLPRPEGRSLRGTESWVDQGER